MESVDHRPDPDELLATIILDEEINENYESIRVTIEPINRVNAKRVPGLLKGKIWLSPDFDAPLEDFKEYM